MFHSQIELYQYKYLTVAIIFDGAIVGIENVPMPIVEQRNSEKKCIRVSCPTDYGDMSAYIYYVSDNVLKSNINCKCRVVWIDLGSHKYGNQSRTVKGLFILQKIAGG